MQEYSTAESCVKAVFPGCKINANRTDNYPLRVVVTAHIGGTNVDVWAGSQKDLFSKYASRRTKSIKQITNNLNELKEDLE
mmetsp:Transcript_18716/g.31995  ORF Transcript_18716/g.31995 Transcript_18716/m.31995 type:complete len:81 (+) Transcript_18716:110-352(+)